MYFRRFGIRDTNESYFKIMKKIYLLSVRTILFVFCMLLSNLKLAALDESAGYNDSHDKKMDVDVEERYTLNKENIARAHKLIEKLYTEVPSMSSRHSGKKNERQTVGTQAGYYGEDGTDQAYSPLVIYRRVWA